MVDWRKNWQAFRVVDGKGLLVDRVDGHLKYSRGGYVWNSWLFRSYFLAVLGALVVVGVQSGVGWQEFYVGCPLDSRGPCENPCYLDGSDHCAPLFGKEFLQPGEEYGRKPTAAFEGGLRFLFWFSLFGVVLVFVLNHFLHNRGRSLSTIFPDLEVGK